MIGVKRVQVVGLERFVGMKWKVLGCDNPGCSNEFGGGDSYTNPEVIRSDARRIGWKCGDDQDLCPTHSP